MTFFTPDPHCIQPGMYTKGLAEVPFPFWCRCLNERAGKSIPQFPRQSVQIVESVREPGARWPWQRIFRHVGIAQNDEELATLKRLAEQVKYELMHHKQPSIPGMEPPMAPLAAEGEPTAAELAPTPVDLR